MKMELTMEQISMKEFVLEKEIKEALKKFHIETDIIPDVSIGFQRNAAGLIRFEVEVKITIIN